MTNKLAYEPLVNWTVMLKAMADESRLRIIQLLLGREMAVNDIAAELGIEAYNVSKHLRILESCRLVVKRKNGIKRMFKVAEGLGSRYSGGILDFGCCKFDFNELRS
ncbi:MAG: metalloregulator ArsR/SmtB family transcription factor [Nitrospirota bacterium]